MSMIEDCLAALEIGLPFAERGDVKAAPLVFDDVLREVSGLEGVAAREAEVLAHYGASRIAAARKQEDERDRRLAAAKALARRIEAPSRYLDAVDMMAETLIKIGETQLAIAYCNRAVELTRRNAAAAAGRLWRAGRCYVRAGFPGQAQAPLREAVAVLRRKKSSPQLPYALLDLGNAFLDSEPAAAEPCYLEAAEIFMKAERVNQAATAWLNLGVMCSRNNRLDEALGWYEKVRASRATDPSTTAAQRGNIHNNIAGVWRRKKDFAQARAEVGKAMAILESVGGPYLAHALGSLGEICRDEGQSEEALVWFRRAREEFERQPSPNVDQLATKLENEAAALDSLGRSEEATAARARIAELKGLVAPAAPTIAPQAKVEIQVKADKEVKNEAVIVTLDGLGLDAEVYEEFDLSTLEHRLETRLEEVGGGELDGHESGPETTRLFLYGPSARALFDAIAPVLLDYPLCRGARIELQHDGETTEFALEAGTRH